VNFDDPGTYHLYFGDETGTPGTVLTFFPFENARPGQVGAGQVGVISFAVPENSLPEWQQRLTGLNIPTSGIQERFGEQVLTLQDPDGLRLKLVGTPSAEQIPGWQNGPVPAEHAIRGFHGATLLAGNLDSSARLLEEVFSFERLAQTSTYLRLKAPDSPAGSIIDLLPVKERGVGGAGTNHHIAWRTPSDSDQLAWLDKLSGLGYRVTPIQDRQYFHSIYFREDSGILFEIATDTPGFLVDETTENLGSKLRLPAWYEASREVIEANLPALNLPVPVNS
ncbi:MAG TPA: ring-cleaving dioxygenase, partial [Anaerolineales bacterium]|nr:ring-cleaving dioxygenase [Anaerolineales bacterium]